MKRTVGVIWMIGAALAGTTAARAEGQFSSEEASVRETPEGIEAVVSINGKRETFRARTWDEFRKRYPKIYERHFRGSGSGGVRSEARSGARSETGEKFRRFIEEVAECPKCQEFGMCGQHGGIFRKIREHMQAQDVPPEVRERVHAWCMRHGGQVKERMVERFDADRDGKLDESERKAARAAIEERHPGLLERYQDRREDIRDAQHDGGKRDMVEDRDRRGPLPDPFHCIRDEREDVWDKREDIRDRREDGRDRREDIWDDAHDGGKRDKIEDRFDQAEDRRDKREDGRDKREDRRDKKK